MNAVQTRPSPCGKYRLETLNATRPGGGTLLEVVVREQATERVIARTSRNYHSAGILHFVSQDGHDYLIISENYHGGHGCIDLATGEKASFTPEVTRPNEQFWCWSEGISHDPETKHLVISGCYWAAPYERITFDFSRPMQPPYPILAVIDEPYEDDLDELPLPPGPDDIEA